MAHGEKNSSLARSAGACPPRSPDPRENRTPTNAVFRSDRGMARDRPSPYGKRHAFFNRSAGACPPRSLDLREKRTQTKAVSSTEAWRGTGPRPTVKGGGLENRSAGACPPRSFDLREKRTQTQAVFPTEARRGTGPRPTVNGTLFLTVARGTSPRATGQDEKKRGGQAPALRRRTARHYSRCFTSPNVVKARFAGETGPGKRRVRNVSGRPPNVTSSIW